MLSEVRLLISSKEARLILKKGETVVEDELWKFERPVSKTEASEVARVMFDDGYDFLQHCVYGDAD